MEEAIDHPLVHCPKARILWDMILTLVGDSWVFSFGRALLWARSAKRLGWQLLFVFVLFFFWFGWGINEGW